jgi:hypothetical protein
MNIYKILIIKPEGMRPLGRHRRRWEDDMKMGPKENGSRVWTGLNWLVIRPSGGLL